MSFSFSQVIEKIFFLKKNNISNIKALCHIVALSNLAVCFGFYFWFFMHININASLLSTSFLVITIVIHTYLNIWLIYWSLSYETPKWIIWAWSSLIFLLPTGLILVFATNNQKYWNLKPVTRRDVISIFHSLANSPIDIDSQVINSLNFLNTHYSSDIKKIFEATGLKENGIKDWHNKFKFFIIALHQSLKNTKKTNISSVKYGAHWYDNRRFDFALIDPKSLIMPKRYKYSVGFIVLDEFNNYQKIVTTKKEIKENIKFGPAKSICLHWGKGFKVYVNE